MLRAALSRRANALDLAPDRPASLLDAEADADTWRLVEVFGAVSFDLELSWAGGAGAGASARVTVARSARICVFARSLRLVARSLALRPGRVGVTVADGQVATANTWEARRDALPDVPTVFEAPPFAHTARLDLLDPLIPVGLRLMDIEGKALASVPVGRPVPLGSAVALELVAPAPATARALFHLSL